jgi:hypothetical protein
MLTKSQEELEHSNVLKRAATEDPSDLDELADTKRVKVDASADIDVAVVETTTTLVSVEPRIESFVVNDTDTSAVDVSADISMTAEDVSGASDVRSDVASAADSGDRDI